MPRALVSCSSTVEKLVKINHENEKFIGLNDKIKTNIIAGNTDDFDLLRAISFFYLSP